MNSTGGYSEIFAPSGTQSYDMELEGDVGKEHLHCSQDIKVMTRNVSCWCVFFGSSERGCIIISVHLKQTGCCSQS